MASILKSLSLISDPTRVRVLLLLRQEELSVAELQEILSLPQSNISAQLAKLKAADPAVELVSITSPNILHKEMALAAITAGKHVYCEKPLTHNVAEGRWIVNEVKKAGVIFQIGFNRRFDPSFRALKRRLDGNEIGAVEQGGCGGIGHSGSEARSCRPSDVGATAVQDRHYPGNWGGCVAQVSSTIRRPPC